MERTKQARVQRKSKREPLVMSRRKTRPKSNLSVSEAVLRDFEKQKLFRQVFAKLPRIQRSYLLSELNSIVESQRIAWIQASNLRDRLIRGKY